MQIIVCFFVALYIRKRGLDDEISVAFHSISKGLGGLHIVPASHVMLDHDIGKRKLVIGIALQEGIRLDVFSGDLAKVDLLLIAALFDKLGHVVDAFEARGGVFRLHVKLIPKAGIFRPCGMQIQNAGDLALIPFQKCRDVFALRLRKLPKITVQIHTLGIFAPLVFSARPNVHDGDRNDAHLVSEVRKPLMRPIATLHLINKE